ncbi:hypothetical protein Poly51_02980 [Rubripirellula tenax]|uniref:Spermatogenesis-associated protein 20-like TRX domain-containing protein n=1 Tax=Rubripirellula tenax TaxID=2528015 RepID=A0A5C6FJU7_9BACT|nr:DUF255 domain-containing protein [Rubripirellula tenax]TWU60024.1 hypothetical protein Poly51_02980 [Rubripirellula tenax]
MKAVALTLLTTLAITLVVSSPANAEIAWQTNLRTAHAQAQAEGKLLLMHFFTDNCSWCDKLEAGAFKDASVGGAISQNFVAVKVHAGQSPKLAEMFKVTKFPTDVIVTTEGKTLAHGVSPQEPSRYVAMLASTLPNLPTQNPAASNSMMASNPMPNPHVQSAPGYALAPAAAPTQQVAAESNTGWELPSGPASIAEAGKLASSRTENLSLSLPEQVSAPTQKQTTAPEINVSVPNVTAAAEKAVATTKQKTADAAANAKKAAAAAVASVAGAVAGVPAEPELAMDGYCAVTVVDDAKWVEGSPEFGVIHLGKLYLFSTQDKMKKFLAEPIPYTPVLNEIDVVRFFEERVIVPGKREYAMQDPTNRRMFFFADEAAMLHFENTYDRYVDASLKVMAEAVQESNPQG